MASRTPSFIVVGLVIIMFLLGSFYMSCSSKNNELRQSLEQFEDRIRLLTIRNSDSEKNIENINSRKRELEEEKLNIQKQMEKKDSEINDLNTKLNEKLSELQSLKSDKTVLDQQLNEFKSMKDTLDSKNSLIEQLKQQLAEQKQAGNDEIARLKHENEAIKDRQPSRHNQLPSNEDQQNNQAPPSDDELRNKFPVPPQRYRPFPINNQTRRSIVSLFQNPINKLNNLTKEIKPEIVAAAVDLKDKVLNVLGVNTSSTTTNQSNEQQEVGQNVPPPPLANNAQRQQQPDHVESAQAAPRSADQPNENNQQADNSPNQQRLQRSVNDSLPNNEKDDEDQLHNEKDDEEQLDKENIQENIPAPVHFNKQDNVNHRIDDNDAPPSPIVKKKRYRKGLHERFQQNQDNAPRGRRLDNGGEIDDDNNNNNNEEDRGVRKRNIL